MPLEIFILSEIFPYQKTTKSYQYFLYYDKSKKTGAKAETRAKQTNQSNKGAVDTPSSRTISFG